MAGQAGHDHGADAARAGSRPQVLRLLQDATAPVSITDIASALGVHPGTARIHLEALLSGGSAEQAPGGRRSPGRPPLLDRAVRRMNLGGRRSYRLLAGMLAGSLAALPDTAARAIEAGRASGRRLAGLARDGATSGAAGHETVVEPEPVDRLVALLDEMSFAPEPRTGAAQEQVQVRLLHCPFLELAEVSAQVICPIHLDLMQGAMTAWSARVTVDRVDPFAEADLCVAHLAAAGAAS